MSKLINWIKAHKVWSTVIALVWVVIILAAAGGGNKQNANTAKSAQPAPSSTKQQTVTPAKTTDNTPKIDYQTVTDKDTGSQHTLVIIVDPTHNNTADLTTLGKQLSQIAASKNEFFYAYVFDDAQAASYRTDVVAGTDTPQQDAVYDPHYIGTYTKNPNTHINRFVIQTKGDQDPNPQTINY